MNGKFLTDLLSHMVVKYLAGFTQSCVIAQCWDLCFLKSQVLSVFHMQWGNRMKSVVLTTGPSLPAGPGLPG